MIYPQIPKLNTQKILLQTGKGEIDPGNPDEYLKQISTPSSRTNSNQHTQHMQNSVTSNIKQPSKFKRSQI